MRAQLLLGKTVAILLCSCGSGQTTNQDPNAFGAGGGAPLGYGGNQSTIGGMSNAISAGGATTGGASSTGGDAQAGGANASGGNTLIGGASGNGGHSQTGGANASGGNTLIGGATATGGKASAGGSSQTGGVNASGGATATGGRASVGGSSQTGGTTAAGGKASTGGTQGTTTRTLTSSTADPTYATSGPWRGYIWPAIESGAALDPSNMTTITPTAATGFRAGGPPYCIKGHVPATPNSLAVAMVGMNTNQERTGGAVAAQWTATGTGILVNVSNPGGSPLRLQIQTNETGAIATLWCAMITIFDQNVTVPWSTFNTKCWNGTGTAYDLSVGISTVMVLVPGTSQTGGYDFDFCVNDLTPV